MFNDIPSGFSPAEQEQHRKGLERIYAIAKARLRRTIEGMTPTNADTAWADITATLAYYYDDEAAAADLATATARYREVTGQAPPKAA